MEISESKKRLSKNVIYLYVRMLVMMIISLLTSRIVLDKLGAVDFGIYNVVGSLVLLFTFINGSLSSSASRFMAYEIGRGTEKSLNRVFCMTVNIHLLFSLIILLFAETAGLWYIYHKMVFPPERQFAAFVVFQLSNISAIITLLSVPYNSMLIAQERMKEFAYLSIVDVITKLGIAFCLYIEGVDKLILYGLLLFISQILVCFLYYFVCRRYFKATKYSFCWNQKAFKEMMVYNGWSIGTYISANFVSQVSNLLLNMFFGPAVNAARAISYQVQTNVSKFVVNFQIALNPQVIKQYATGDIKSVESLSNLSVKIAFCLMFIILCPLLVNIDSILSLWLKEVPPHTNIFVVLVCWAAMFGSMANVFSVVAQAANRLKLFTLSTMPLYLISIPFCYMILILGSSAEMVLVVTLVVQMLELLLKYFLARYIIKSKMNETLKIIIRCMVTSILFFVLGYLLYQRGFSGMIYFITSICVTLLIASIWCCFFIIDKKERQLFLLFIKKKISRR